MQTSQFVETYLTLLQELSFNRQDADMRAATPRRRTESCRNKSRCHVTGNELNITERLQNGISLEWRTPILQKKTTTPLPLLSELMVFNLASVRLRSVPILSLHINERRRLPRVNAATVKLLLSHLMDGSHQQARRNAAEEETPPFMSYLQRWSRSPSGGGFRCYLPTSNHTNTSARWFPAIFVWLINWKKSNNKEGVAPWRPVWVHQETGSDPDVPTAPSALRAQWGFYYSRKWHKDTKWKFYLHVFLRG